MAKKRTTHIDLMRKNFAVALKKLDSDALTELAGCKRKQAVFRRKLLDSVIKAHDTTNAVAVACYSKVKKELEANGTLQKNVLGRTSPAYTKQD